VDGPATVCSRRGYGRRRDGWGLDGKSNQDGDGSGLAKAGTSSQEGPHWPRGEGSGWEEWYIMIGRERLRGRGGKKGRRRV
jgi:hypothetical protein